MLDLDGTHGDRQSGRSMVQTRMSGLGLDANRRVERQAMSQEALLGAASCHVADVGGAS